MKASMQTLTVFLLLLGNASYSMAASDRGDHPIPSVIEMLKGLITKVKFEGTKESEAYMKFDHWCRNSVSDLEKAITEEKETIEVLTDTISSKTEEKELLEKQIGELDQEIAGLHSASVKARKERDAEASVYSQVSSDLEATIKAVEDALALLEDSKATTGHLFLAQQHVRRIMALAEARASPAQRKQLEAFLDVGKAAPAPAPRPPFFAKGDMTDHIDQYSFKSGGVIELLKQLRLKFQDELREATELETNDINGYKLGQLSRDNAVTAADTAKTEKAGILVDTKNELAKAQADLASEKSDLEADSKSLSDTENACEIKKSEWETRSGVRSNELEAMETAIKILSKVTGVRTDAPENPVPPPSPVFLQKAFALLQLTSGAAPRDPREAARRHAVELLRDEARSTHSHALEGLAQEVAAHRDGPFNDIVNMVQKMIFQLMNEQKNEDDHKNWCDQEINKTAAMEINKEERIAELASKIEAAEATVAQLTLDIKDANALLAKIDAYMEEATTIRKVGKSENAEAVKDAQDAQTALAHAIAVLTDFYKQSGMMEKEAWEFVQQPVKLSETPSTWESSYSGVADPEEPLGIITVLQKIASEFETMEADTKAQEEADQKAYDELMSTNDIEKSRRTEEVALKTQEKKRLTGEIASMTSLKKQITTELASVKQYEKDLKPACVTGDSTYADRKSARTQEITALKEVQGILQNAFVGGAPAPSPVFLQVRRHGLQEQ